MRIIRACREMGIATVAVYSEADREALHAKLADEAICIGEAPASESYLSMERIISAAVVSGADAVHPGFGFLSENSRFADLCRQCGITFIGPAAEVIEKLGNKQEARRTMTEAGVPVVPGTEEALEDWQEAFGAAEKTGYPMMIKAALGGGGKGMREVYDPADFEEAFRTAQKEALGAFGDGRMYLERLIKNPRHIEFQILADNYGNVVHLGERDCSIQRNHQKLIEEAPSMVLTDKLREKMGEAAVKAAKAAGYVNAGTIEFLLDKENHFYFMEMNTRIQVEHGVTEEITGYDLIGRQIRIAQGEILDLTQHDIHAQGFAIEARINAEDVANDFVPNPGKITTYYPALGPFVRVDSCIYKDYVIPPFYDSMVAKLIVRASSYNLAVNKLARALDEFTIKGVKTTIPFLINICNDKDFRRGYFDTSYIENKIDELMPTPQSKPEDDMVSVIVAALSARYGA